MPRTVCLVVAAILIWGSACSKNEDGRPGAAASSGSSDTAVLAAEAGGIVMPKVAEAVRLLSRPEPTIDLVAARLEGRITERKTGLAIIEYTGYRILLTTPGDLVTRIDFDLEELRPTVGQLTDRYGTPEPIRNTLLFRHENADKTQTINVTAEPVEMPGEPATPVKKIIVRGARRY